MQSLFESLALGLHIPDGFLSVPVSLLWWALTAVAVAVSVRKVGGELNERQVPLMGVMAAFIFAGQMLNFPVLGGTSGHLVGGALAALLLGPWAGVLVMTAVVALQALLFQDGGLVVMGANIFNMGVSSALLGYFIGMPLLKLFGGTRWGLVIVGFITAWLTVQVAALLTAAQLVFSGLSAAVVFPPMMFVHAFIGIGEGLITVAALGFVVATRPDLVQTLAGYLSPAALQQKVTPATVAAVTAVGLGMSALATLIAPLASADPDGLERVAEDTGFLERAQDAPFQIIPDYTVPFLGETALSTIVAGLIGLAISFAVIYGLAMVLRGDKSPAS
jgi:cobalt/nickel transport system permease protein